VFFVIAASLNVWAFAAKDNRFILPVQLFDIYFFSDIYPPQADLFEWHFLENGGNLFTKPALTARFSRLKWRQPSLTGVRLA
jgi:hypothetical protein